MQIFELARKLDRFFRHLPIRKKDCFHLEDASVFIKIWFIKLDEQKLLFIFVQKNICKSKEKVKREKRTREKNSF